MLRITAAMLVSASLAAAAGAAGAAETITPFMQGVARLAAGDEAMSAFYRSTGYEAIWTDAEEDDRERLAALVTAFSRSDHHALPAGAFTADAVRRRLQRIRTDADRGRAEVEISRLFLDYAHAVQSGVISPDAVSDEIKRSAPRREGSDLLQRLVDGTPEKVMRSLPPATPEYGQLVRARMDLKRTISAGGWGPPVPEGRYEVGVRGAGVIALRNRLIAMGYLPRTAHDTYDKVMAGAVRQFQADHGLVVDGITGGETITEINRDPEDRLAQVVVAMERERWLNIDRGDRHVWVNLADYSVTLLDHGAPTFATKAVVGSARDGRRSPEFSDVMEHMVINPSWHVPRSIAINEYLPAFRANRYANSHLLVYYRGQPIARERINFSAVTPQNWPFQLRQPPSRSNALGLVKFMFPNRWNIYLHDTPEKHLFDRSARAYSHGCIRLHEPFEFAYALLEPQTADPRGVFEAHLATGRETQVNLETEVPVHLVYRTAFADDRGHVQFRPDVYGRDDAVIAALEAAGVEVVAHGS
jgi:murein L,D-transpeptidase YcbB/YkuD